MKKMKKIHKNIILMTILIVAGVLIFMFLKINNKDLNKNILIKEENNQTQTSLLKIGFITDAHCYANLNKDTGEWKLNWRCEKPLEAFVDRMNNIFNPDFVIENGDFIDGKDDRSQETFVEALNFYNQVKAPKYHVLGNHETRGFIKKTWLDLVGYEKPYYYFDMNGYRIIVLDGNNKPAEEGESFNTSPENEFYPGFIDPVQMIWLENLLLESKEYQKVVFVHQPLIIEEKKTQDELFIGGMELRDLFSKNKVRAVFSGHTERFCYLNENGVDYYVSQGFWKANRGLKKEYQFKDDGVFSEILIDNDDVNVVSYYNPEMNSKSDSEYQSFELVPEEMSCLDGKKIAEDDD